MEKNLADEFGLRKIGRLAFRVDGKTWQAYYALPDTMDGALPLASIQMALVLDQERKHEFMMLMQNCVSDIIEDTTGTRPEWPDEPQPAPEHERSGSA
jgi:hypothetical protein